MRKRRVAQYRPSGVVRLKPDYDGLLKIGGAGLILSCLESSAHGSATDIYLAVAPGK